ncbi:phosphoserine phosphatase isoform X2 [Sitodiplosis mosellana]|uniref:phosphoserine phosphatase isoform X2 n=1 Tax=Sitodiplosis mosellana TaxID=263140 RepID=UPI00244516A8|nr:phosphoserine phosphatase isoform X2 [Sitodiplosis mosellana]
MYRLNSSLISLVAISANPAENATSLVSNGVQRTTAPTILKPVHNGNGSTTLVNMTNSEPVNIGDKSKNAAAAAQVIRNSEVVCFDVDSTVIREEGIDELAQFCGKGQEVARLTKEAMKGSMTFQEALRLRLNIIQPTQQQIREFLKSRPSTLSPGIMEFVSRLRDANKTVYLITGGFDCLIEPVADELGIPLDHMFANRLFFNFNGKYAGFDVNQPTSRTGGKGEAINIIRRSLGQNVSVTMIGDGATDLEAAPPADNFIGYGGNVVREEVRNRAQYYVTDFQQLYKDL